MSKQDHTAEIYTALGVTPETHPWAYKVNDGDTIWNLENFLKWYSMEDADHYPYSLLDGDLESDGLAVRLVVIATGKISMPWYRPELEKWFCNSYNAHKLSGCYTSKSFARTVHDALVEALGINKNA